MLSINNAYFGVGQLVSRQILDLLHVGSSPTSEADYLGP